MSVEQNLKLQLGELLWLTHLQSAEIERLNQELLELKKEKENATDVQ